MDHQTLIEVTAEHCDELGHLSHVEAVRYLETAREEWYVDAGLYLEPREDGALVPVVVNLDINYRLECFRGDRLRVVTRPVSMRTRSFVLGQEIRKADDSVAIDCAATSVIQLYANGETAPVVKVVRDNRGNRYQVFAVSVVLSDGFRAQSKAS